MENGKWVFGIEHLWLLAPTRHGAHNWEGPGELTAMMALKSLGKLIKDAPWISPQADVDCIIFAGHSMGGHGHGKLFVIQVNMIVFSFCAFNFVCINISWC